MDSMKSLNSSLPSSRPRRTAPPEELLQAFRTAALSVTQLYKSAASSQVNARQAGYQDALEDLLKFLDRENLGLQDGEGWRVRQWATARYDGTSEHDEEDELDEETFEAESVNASNLHSSDRSNNAQEERDESTNTSGPDTTEDSNPADRSSIFHFTSNTQPDNDMQTERDGSLRPVNDPSSSNTPIRVEVVNRNSRPASRSHQSRPITHTNSREFTFTTGTKRKLQFPDFFDISNWNDMKDGSGGGGGASKKGRVV